MHPQQRRLIQMIAVGGAAVLGSYAWGALARPDAMGALWGGVPEALRPLYTVNMFLAAGGFFLFASYILRLPPETTRVAGGRGYGFFPLMFLLILVPSALWLPLTARMVEAPGTLLWWLIRLDLALVGIGALGLGVALLTLRAPASRRGRGWALVGLAPFFLQTAVLDAIVWPIYFPTP